MQGAQLSASRAAALAQRLPALGPQELVCLACSFVDRSHAGWRRGTGLVPRPYAVSPASFTWLLPLPW